VVPQLDEQGKAIAILRLTDGPPNSSWREEAATQGGRGRASHVPRVGTLGEMTASIAHANPTQPLAGVGQQRQWPVCAGLRARLQLEESRQSSALIIADVAVGPATSHQPDSRSVRKLRRVRNWGEHQ